MKNLSKLILTTNLLIVTLLSYAQNYPIVDTDVHDHYDNTSIITAPTSGQAFYGQDATYNGNQPSYTDNGDGTITDNVTGLMWEQDMGSKIAYYDAFMKASTSTLGGYTDWRVPTIKELYSLAQFSGRCMGDNAMFKFIDTNYFNQPIGNTALNEREIDAQTWSSTKYVGLTMGGDSTVFGFNFVDGRLKGYPMYQPPTFTVATTMYFRMVRGNTSYGINNFVDNGDGTITDNATGLMWQQADDGNTRDWEDALAYAENLTLAGHSDWRLPNAKELHSILDYTRSRSTTSSAAIDPLFSCTSFNDPDGNPGQYGYYWTGSPLMDGPSPYSDAVYICFGEAQGKMNNTLMDTHGAGAQRNDTKTGIPANYPQYFGPQGDVVYVFNYTRCVRMSGLTDVNEESGIQFKIYPNPASDVLRVQTNSILDRIIIYDIIGKEIQHLSPTKKNTTINTATLTIGVYFVHLISDTGEIKSEKVVISR